jgi:predicted ATPase
VQDSAYDTLLRGPRQRLHERIANALEPRFSGSSDIPAELIAQHWGYAGSARKAISYWLKAAEKSIDRSVIADAQVQFEKGLEPLSAMPDEADRRRHELALQPPLAGTDGRKGPFNTGNGSGSAAGPSAVRRLGRDDRANR